MGPAQIMREANDRLNLPPVRIGRARVLRKALGYFSPAWYGVGIRSKELVKLDVHAHEAMGHALFQRLYGKDIEAWERSLQPDQRTELEQLGKGRFDSLMVQANTYKKKDRKIQRLIWREVLKSLK